MSPRFYPPPTQSQLTLTPRLFLQDETHILVALVRSVSCDLLVLAVSAMNGHLDVCWAGLGVQSLMTTDCDRTIVVCPVQDADVCAVQAGLWKEPPGMNLAAPYLPGVGNGRYFGRLCDVKMAERAGFEPAIPQRGIPVFETGAFNHSATSPCRGVLAEALPAGPKSSVG